MRFEQIRANADAIKALRNMVDTDKVPHALLMYENDGGGAFALTLAFLQYLYCRDKHDGHACGECPTCHKIEKLIHPDVHFVFPTNSGSKSGKTAAQDITSDMYMKEFKALAKENPYFLESDLSAAIGIEAKVGTINVAQAKLLMDRLYLTPVENSYKAVVFLQPEKLVEQAASKLLKLVEEPPENTIFIFITHKPDRVLQTIFSRCQSMRILPMSKEDVADVLVQEYGMDRDEAVAKAAGSAGSVGRALYLAEGAGDMEQYREIFSSMMDAAIAKDLLTTLDAADMAAALDSREKQKAFCAYASSVLRQVFFTQQKMKDIAYVTPQDEALVAKMAASCPKSFCRKVNEYIDGAVSMIDRNVSQKIVFCDLANRIFMSI